MDNNIQDQIEALNARHAELAYVEDQLLALQMVPPPIAIKWLELKRDKKRIEEEIKILSSIKPVEHTEIPDALTVSQVAADSPPYMVKWNLCRRSKTFNDTEEKVKQFDDFNIALQFLTGRHSTIHANYWAGGVIEDSVGKVVTRC